jgi:hypothetical protein
VKRTASASLPHRRKDLASRFIDVTLLQAVDKLVIAAMKAASLRAPPRARLAITGHVYNLALIGAVRTQSDVEQRLRQWYRQAHQEVKP